MTTPPGNAEAPSLFFTGARECKAWLAGLPVSNVAQSQASVLDALRVFNRTDFDPLERLKCLELLRERSAFMASELRARHFSRALPLSPADAAAWTISLGVLEELETGYRRCLAEGAIAEHAALASQRVVRCVGAQMLLHAIVYRPFDAALWSRLHQQYAAAESAGYAEERVKDSLESEGGSSVMEAYARAVLLHAAGLHEMTPAQVVFTEAVLKQWMRKVTVLATAPEGTPAICPMVVDLSQSRGAEPAPCDRLAPAQRVIEADGLVRSIRRRVRALQAGEDVGSLGLPAEAAAVDPLHVLARLARRWSEAAPRAAVPDAPTVTSAGVVHGLADIHFFLSGGKVFEQPGKERELTRQEKEDIAVFGRITERTQSVVAAASRTQASMNAPAQTFTVEPWDVLEETVDTLRIRRRPAATRPVSVGRIVALRLGETGPLMIGIVRAIVNEPAGLVLSVGTLPGKPEPIAARGSNPAWSQAIALPAIEKLGVPRSLLVPSGVAFRGRTIHLWQTAATQAQVGEILERGADFDRVTLA